MPKPDLSAELCAIITRWDAIEGRLKQAEQVCGDAVVAAINELRYAGRQFVDAMTIYLKDDLTEDDTTALRKHLQNVQYNLMNADHDCTDAVCLFFHERVKRITSEYRLDVILKHFPEFTELFERMEGANAAISSSRENRPNRATTYQALAEFHVPQLYSFNRKILTSEPLMLAQRRKDAMKKGLLLTVGAILLVLGTIVVVSVLRT